MYSVRYSETASRAFGYLTPQQRRTIIRIVANITLNPFVDKRVKFTLWEVGMMYIIYRDHSGAWVVYTMENNLITISGVGVGSPYIPYAP